MLYYNKAQFAAAGISQPPQSMNELVTDAAKLTTPQHAGFCMRATVDQSNYFTGQMMLLYFLNYNSGNQGTFLNPSWEPQLTTPEATAFANTFKQLEVQYGPKGISGYGYQECETALNQGKVSMFWETDAFASAVNDPEISNQAQHRLRGHTVPGELSGSLHDGLALGAVHEQGLIGPACGLAADAVPHQRELREGRQ